MALTPLATVADLQKKGIDVTHPDRVASFLAAASAEVRDAAGVPILRDTFTVDLPVIKCEPWLMLPGQPVTAVADVKIDGTTVTGWKLVGGNLWRASGWLANPYEPGTATATITGGLLAVPDDIIDLVAGLIGLALAESEGGYQSRGDLVGVRVDDASEQYATAADRVAGVMELPATTRARLRSKFGGGYASLRQR